MKRRQILNILTICSAVLFILGLYITFESGMGWTWLSSEHWSALVTGALLTIFSGIALLMRWKAFIKEE